MNARTEMERLVWAAAFARQAGVYGISPYTEDSEPGIARTCRAHADRAVQIYRLATGAEPPP